MGKIPCTLIAALCFISAACNDGSRPDTPPAEDREAIESQRISAEQNIQPLRPEKLRSMLPKVLPGAQALEPSIGSQENNGRVLTSVTGEYTVVPQGTISISITDYTDLHDMVNNLTGYIDKAIDGEKIENSNGRGLQVWNAETGSGLLRFLALRRYSISIEFVGITEASAEFYTRPADILEYIDFNAMRIVGARPIGTDSASEAAGGH